MATPLEVESLFAAIGLEAILEGRPTLHKYQLVKAARLDDEIRRRMLRFVSTDAVAEAAGMAPFDYDQVLRQLSTPADPSGTNTLSPEQAAALFARVPDRELAQDLAIQANRILTWAAPLVPRQQENTVMGVEPDEPPPTAVADFRRVWQVAADPMTVMADLEDGSLNEDQVAAVALLYPQLYAEMRQALQDALSAVGARRAKGWEPSPRKADLIGILRQQSATDPGLTAAVQQVYAQQPQQAPQTPPRPRKSKAGEASADLTPGEKAAAG